MQSAVAGARRNRICRKMGRRKRGHGMLGKKEEAEAQRKLRNEAKMYKSNGYVGE